MADAIKYVLISFAIISIEIKLYDNSIYIYVFSPSLVLIKLKLNYSKTIKFKFMTDKPFIFRYENMHN